MMRYRRYKARKSRVVKMKFQSFVDISTQADTMKIISVMAGGPDVLRRLAPFFGAYKYYKLGGVSFKMIPASTLPVDPLQLSYDSSDLDAVDPRDQLTPGMCRITNGEDILEDLTGLTGDQQRELYNNMLLDPRWFKWMLQSGVKRYGKPRYWQIGQLHQDKFPGATFNMPSVDTIGNSMEGTVNRTNVWRNSATVNTTQMGSSYYGLFQTGHRGTLGWLPTDSMQEFFVSATDGGITRKFPLLAAVPEVELFKILMPPVRKTNYFYRCFITETVYFRDPIVMNINGYRPLDVFHYCLPDAPTLPSTNQGTISDSTMDHYTGGNDGSN